MLNEDMFVNCPNGHGLVKIRQREYRGGGAPLLHLSCGCLVTEAQVEPANQVAPALDSRTMTDEEYQAALQAEAEGATDA